MNARSLTMIVALVAIAAIAVIAMTTPGIPIWVTIALVVLIAGNLAWSQVRTAKLAATVLETLRAKGPMTVSQVAHAIDRPDARLRVIAALARLRARGAVTRAPLEAEVPGGDAKDSHLYTAA